MLDVAILGQVAFGYSPFIDKNRSVSATRLTVFPLKPDMAVDAIFVWRSSDPKKHKHGCGCGCAHETEDDAGKKKDSP